MIKFDFKKSNINNIHGLVILRPGINEVEEQKWDKVKDTAQIKEWLNKGIILMIADSAIPGPGPGPLPVVEKKKATEVIEEVKKMTNVDDLKKLREIDDRKTVKVAVDEQIEALEKAEDDASNNKSNDKSDDEPSEADKEKAVKAEIEVIEKIKNIADLEVLEKMKKDNGNKAIEEAITEQIKILKEADAASTDDGFK